MHTYIQLTNHVALMPSPPHWVLKLRVNVPTEVLEFVLWISVEDLLIESLLSDGVHHNTNFQLLKIV